MTSGLVIQGALVKLKGARPLPKQNGVSTQPTALKGPNMKRDMDLIRRIALETSDMDFGYVIANMEDEGIDAATFGMHVIWMHEAGLIKAVIQEYASGEPPRVQVSRLTWAGCEFVDAIRDDTLWAKAKTSVLKPGMSFTFDVLKEWLKTEITQGLPTLRAFGQ